MSVLSAKNINTSLSYSTKYNTTILNLSFILLLLASCTQEELLDGLSNQQATSEENLAGVPAETSVTQAQAVAVANQILGCRSSQTRSKSTPPAIEEVKANGETLIYVINYQDGGFAVISGKTTYLVQL